MNRKEQPYCPNASEQRTTKKATRDIGPPRIREQGAHQNDASSTLLWLRHMWRGGKRAEPLACRGAPASTASGSPCESAAPRAFPAWMDAGASRRSRRHVRAALSEAGGRLRERDVANAEPAGYRVRNRRRGVTPRIEPSRPARLGGWAELDCHPSLVGIYAADATQRRP